MAKRKKKRNTSTLRQHRQTGKILSPPMMTIQGMTSVPWLRDTFPDMMWLAMLVTEYGTSGMHTAAQLLDIVDEVMDQPDGPGRPDRLVLTGQLTAFEKVPEASRPAILEALRSDDLFERAVPWVFARGLMKYTDVPGMRLFNGWQGNVQIVPAGQPERLLAKIVEDHSHGQSASATRAKAMVLRAWLKAGKMHLPREVGEEWANILPRYPDRIREEERRRIEPSIRAAFLAIAGQDFGADNKGSDPAPIAWAKTFWRSNWKLYKCRVTNDGDKEKLGTHRESGEAIREAREHWREQLAELTGKMLKVARDTDPDLYSSDRHEVLTG